MPLGGYCEVCERWVWVTGSGECQFGHPAHAVHDVQLLKPEGGALVLAGGGPVARSRGPEWFWRHSLWMPLTFTFGFLNWVAFFWIGVRARRLSWIVSGFVYLMPLLLTVALIDSRFLGLAIAVQLFLSAVSILQAFLVRPQYRAIMFGHAPAGSLPRPPSLLTQRMRAPLPRGLDADVAQVLRDAQSMVDGVARAGDGIEKEDVRRKVGRLCASAQEILDQLRKKPAQVELARSFLTYYLEAADRIVRGYADLARRRLDSPELREALAGAEASLTDIQGAFDDQLAGLLQHDLFGLETEIALLEKTVQMDNLLRLPPTPSDTSPRALKNPDQPALPASTTTDPADDASTEPRTGRAT